MLLCDISAVTNWIQAVAAVVLVVLTLFTLLVLIRYAADTKRIAEASVSQTENSQMPCLVVTRLYEPSHRPIGWGIQNQGTGPALNIRFTGFDGGNKPAIKPTPPLGAGEERLLSNDIEQVFLRWPKDFRLEYESLSGVKYFTTIDNAEDRLYTEFHKPPAVVANLTIGDFLRSFRQFMKSRR